MTDNFTALEARLQAVLDAANRAVAKVAEAETNAAALEAKIAGMQVDHQAQIDGYEKKLADIEALLNTVAPVPVEAPAADPAATASDEAAAAGIATGTFG